MTRQTLRSRFMQWGTLLVALMLIGCGETSTSRDASDVQDARVASEDVVIDQAMDRFDAGADDGIDLTDLPVPETTACAQAIDVRVQNSPEVYAIDAGLEECVVSPDASEDAGMVCAAGAQSSCECSGGRTGMRSCRDDLRWDPCVCAPSDGGMDGGVPHFTEARLLTPWSGARATSQRPTFRWVLPEGVGRARVELCADRACAREITHAEVAGTTWRPSITLPPGVVFWRVRALGASGEVTWTSATWEFVVRRRDTPTDISYGTLKDFNGDGYDDLVVNTGGQRIDYVLRVYWGGSGGVDAARFQGINPPFSVSAETPDDIGEFGWVVSAGDLNGDGLADLVVTASTIGEVPFVSSRVGRVSIYYGSRRCGLTRDARIWQSGSPVPNSFGSDASAGDFNGDGFDDLLVVGVFGSEPLSLYLGAADGPSDRPTAVLANFGEDGQFVGDVNGDGYADAVVRTIASRESSDVAILYGNSEADLGCFIQPISHPKFTGYFGNVIRGADLNADGFSDVIVSSFGDVTIYFGSAAGVGLPVRLAQPPFTYTTSEFGSFGGSIAWPGDVEGSGRMMMLIGSADALTIRDDSRGRVFTYRNVSDAIRVWSGVIASDRDVWGFGLPAIPGDLDGDGRDDVAIGAPVAHDPPQGEVQVFYGSQQIECTPRFVLRGRVRAAFGSVVF